jgi:hypothetical protein
LLVKPGAGKSAQYSHVAEQERLRRISFQQQPLQRHNLSRCHLLRRAASTCGPRAPSTEWRIAMNDNEPTPVTIITGRVFRRKGGRAEGVHVMLVAPDDDSAVRRALESLAKEGFAEAELDQIGEMEGPPDEEPHASAYQGALEGEVSIITFDEEA